MSILTQPTLVLNRYWIPINTVSVRRALTMVSNDWFDERNKKHTKAQILDVYESRTYDFDEWIELPTRPDEGIIHGCGEKVYRAPEIIIVSRYGRIPKNQLNFNRKNVFRRDCDECQYCGCHPPRGDLSIDHVIPRSKGGGSTWENCVTACYKCNQKKADKTLQQSGMHLIKIPRKPGMEVLGNNHKIKSWEIYFGRQTPDGKPIT
jgi:5-methylcytosine-specific restriction endonuclease McrA